MPTSPNARPEPSPARRSSRWSMFLLSSALPAMQVVGSNDDLVHEPHDPAEDEDAERPEDPAVLAQVVAVDAVGTVALGDGAGVLLELERWAEPRFGGQRRERERRVVHGDVVAVAQEAGTADADALE